MKSYDKTLTRLIIILTKLTNNELPTIKELAEEFNVGIRTIQRDVYQRLIYFPIEKDSLNRLKFIEGFSLDRSSLADDEMLLIYLAMSQVKSMSNNFEKKINNIFSKLLNPSFTSPYFVKANDHEKINFNSKMIKKIELAILNTNIIDIIQVNRITTAKPYKIINIDGLWYLFAKDISEGKIKSFLISEIQSVINSNNTFKLTTDVDEVLSNVHSAFFDDGNSFEVKVHIDANVAYYFKLKKLLPTQKIIEELDTGSLIVTFEISHYEDIDNIIKAWLPDIKVLEPKEYKVKLENELKAYLTN